MWNTILLLIKTLLFPMHLLHQLGPGENTPWKYVYQDPQGILWRYRKTGGFMPVEVPPSHLKTGQQVGGARSSTRDHDWRRCWGALSPFPFLLGAHCPLVSGISLCRATHACVCVCAHTCTPSLFHALSKT